MRGGNDLLNGFLFENYGPGTGPNLHLTFTGDGQRREVEGMLQRAEVRHTLRPNGSSSETFVLELRQEDIIEHQDVFRGMFDRIMEMGICREPK